MTGNVGADKLQKEVSLGFASVNKDDDKQIEVLHEKNKTSVMDSLKKLMRPELINRIDKIIVFRALSKYVIRDIIDVQLDDLRKRMQKQRLGLEIKKTAKEWLLEKGYDSKNGVRPLRRVIQDEIEDEIAEGVLSDVYKAGDVVAVDLKKDALVFSTVKE